MYWLMGIFLLSLASCSPKAAPPPRPHQVVTVCPTLCPLPTYAEYVGHLEAKISVEVRAQVSGILLKQHFVEGSEVKKGDLLLTIDPRSYQAAVESAAGALLESEANLSFAEEKTERYAKLLEEEFVSKLDYDQFVTNVLTTKALCDQNKANLWSAKINLDHCFIRAPMDCVTGVLSVKPGNYVDSAADVVLTTLNQIQPILVNFTVPEDDLYAIQKAQQNHPLSLEVFLDGEKTRSCKGALSLINNQVNASTGALLCQGTLPNEDKLLWPGHFVDVRLILEEAEEKMVLPSQAVLVGQAGHYVYTVGPDQTIRVAPVAVGQRHGEFFVIKQGVTVEDRVVLEGQLNLYPGLHVETRPHE